MKPQVFQADICGPFARKNNPHLILLNGSDSAATAAVSQTPRGYDVYQNKADHRIVLVFAWRVTATSGKIFLRYGGLRPSTLSQCMCGPHRHRRFHKHIETHNRGFLSLLCTERGRFWAAVRTGPEGCVQWLKQRCLHACLWRVRLFLVKYSSVG